MILHVTTAEYLHGYTLAVSFNNGQKGIADLTDALGQGLFQSLGEIELFRKVSVDDELKTIVWPNGLDLAPEYVYFQAFKDNPKLNPNLKLGATWKNRPHDRPPPRPPRPYRHRTGRHPETARVDSGTGGAREAGAAGCGG